MAQPKPQTIKSLQADAARQAFPLYNPLLQAFAQNAGIPFPQQQMASQMTQPAPQTMARTQPLAGRGGFGMQPQRMAQQMGGQGAPMASIQPMPNVNPQQQQLADLMSPQQPGPPNSALGPWGSNPADVFRLQQAEEDVNRMADQRARMLAYRLGQQGIGGSGTAAAALAQNERGALSDLGNFRRQLAINAGPEQERRLQLLAQILGLGAGFGSQAQGVNLQQQQIQASKPSFLQQATGLAGLFT